MRKKVVLHPCNTFFGIAWDLIPEMRYGFGEDKIYLTKFIIKQHLHARTRVST
jgi:hypothetical protein